MELKLLPETFDSDIEENYSKIFQPLQLKMLHNLILERLKVKSHMPATEEHYTHKQEYLRGQMDQLIELIQTHEVTSENLNIQG